MKKSTYRSELLLLCAAVIWGFGFVAQREGMAHIGPYAFNAVRYTLATLCLIPFLCISERRSPEVDRDTGGASLLWGVGLAGGALFLGSAFQQSGIVTTTAGNTGFITGLYTVIVPAIALFRGHRVGRGTWVGALIAVVGLYLLSVTDSLTIGRGDFLVLLGAFFWAGHVTLIDHFSPKLNALRLAVGQFAVCALLSFVGALFFESADFSGTWDALIPILYAGIMSIAIGFTLQIIGQRDANPTHAAIIMSLEGVFAAVGGWLLLDERLAHRGVLGCGLMLVGMLVSQLASARRG